MENIKIVDFGKCKTCKHFDLADSEYPCDECLAISARESSHTPEYYEKEEKKERKNASK